MSARASSSVKKPETGTTWLACQRCEKVTRHEALTRVAEYHESPGGDIQVWNDYLTVRCNGCGTVSFAVASSCSEDVEYDSDTGHERLSVSYKLYPNRVARRPQMRFATQLPHSIYCVYQETHDSMCSDKPILAGIGIRAIVDAVCKVKKVEGGTLEKKIDNLVTMGFIASEGADFLHRIRSLGNKAAHEVEAHSDQELAAAMEIVEQLLQAVFVLPGLAKTLPEAPKRSPKKSSAIKTVVKETPATNTAKKTDKSAKKSRKGK